MVDKQRTINQNKALHLWATELAREANAHGVSYKAVVENLTVDWTLESVKSIIHAISKSMYGKTSTADLTTTELTNVCKEVDKIFLEKGINIIFPSFESKSLVDTYTQ